MAAVERFIVARGWHIPRWRTTNKDYGNFYQQRHRAAHSSKEPLQHLDAHPPPHLPHVVDYINCNDRCGRPPHLRQHPGSVGMPSVSSSCRENESLGPPFLRSCVGPAHHQGPGLNAHIQHLTLQEERSPTICGSEHLPCMQSRHADYVREVWSMDERPPWKPKPLKPMILFEKKAKELEKERSLDRQTPYKRKKSGEWLHAPSPPSKRQQINYNVLSEAQSIQGIHPATRRYSYYKYYGFLALHLCENWVLDSILLTRAASCSYMWALSEGYIETGCGFFDKESATGEVVGKMFGDTILIQDAIGEKVGKVIQLVLTFIGRFAVAFVKGWKLTLMMLVTIPPMVVVGAVVMTLLSKATSRGQTAYAEAGDVVEQALGAIRTIAASVGENKSIEVYSKKLKTAFVASIRQGLVFGYQCDLCCTRGRRGGGMHLRGHMCALHCN